MQYFELIFYVILYNYFALKLHIKILFSCMHIIFTHLAIMSKFFYNSILDDSKTKRDFNLYILYIFLSSNIIDINFILTYNH